MKNACWLSMLSACVAVAGSVWSASGPVVIENANLRMAFSSDSVPVMCELVRKPSGTNMVAAGGSSLFVLQAVQTNGSLVFIESRQAGRGTVSVQPDGAGQRVRLTFEGFASCDGLSVTLDGRLADDAPDVRWTVAIDNPERQRLRSLRFPYVRAVPVIGKSDDDFIIGPALPGVIIENPALKWPSNYSTAWTFPGNQSVQFCTYQDASSGIYLASLDTVGYGRSLNAGKQKDAIVLYQEFPLPDEAVTRWVSPYETALGVTAGSWQDSADIYKRWAVRQSWCAKTLAQRDDIPDYWKAGPCIHTCEVRTYGTNRLCSGSYYPQLLGHMRSLRERLGGAPVVPMLPGWENHRRWTAGAYFPIFDEVQANGVLAQLSADGFRPFVYLSGLNYTYRNEGRDGGDVSGWERYVDDFVVDSAKGKPKTYVLDESSPGKDCVWRRHSYGFCPAASGTHAFFREVIDRLHGLGIDIVQLDQTTSGAGDACASTSHGHPAGRGSYQSQAFRDLMADMRRHGKSLTPDFMLAHEECHEELIPLLDAFHTREYRERWWYHGVPGGRSLPLFTYLYHEYAIAYGGEGPHATASKSPEVVRELAVNLVTGKTPAVSVWSNQKAMGDVHPDLSRMLRNHTGLLQAGAQPFLVLGRMLHALDIETETVTLKIKNQPFVERAVLTSSWLSPDGRIGHCFVNITDKPQTVRFTLDTRGATAWKTAGVELIRPAPAARTPPCEGVALPQPRTLELEPLDAVVMVLTPSGKW